MKGVGGQCHPFNCCVCSRRQHAVDMREVVLDANNNIPDYFSILHNDHESLLADNEFRFADPRLNGLMLDPVLVFYLYL